MASGFGLNGGPSRCFPFWQEVLACYVVNANAEDPKSAGKCIPALDDYHECLHHTKEHARVRAIQTAYRKKQAENPREDGPTAGEIRRLGLLDKPLEELNLKASSLLPHVKSNVN